jgi:hypothetical protein
MDIVTIIIVVLAVGVLVWAVDRYLPAAQPFKGIAILLIILLAVIWILSGTGIGLPHWRVHR